MSRLSMLSAFVASLAASIAASSAPTCGSGTSCPQSAPCCSQYGQCGAGAYCLGGCDPINSFDLNSCVPAPVCQSANYKLTSLSDVEQNTIYLGDVSTGTNWVASGTPAVYTDGSGQKSILLTMAPDTVGTLLTSTHYVWYGKISTTMKTSAGQGVVTAFVMMSDVKDEIDFEFVGADLQHAQSNFYWQGVPDYNNELNLTATNTNTQTHTYTIDWTPDTLTWYVDGSALRTLKKSDTYNTTDNTYHYPQTPSRIQLSLWPAGKAGNPQGTIDWAGGLISWSSQYMSNGYYYAQVEDVTVECYQPPSGANVTGSKSYSYFNTAGLQSDVAITDNQVVLSSFYATGDNPTYNPNGGSSKGSSSLSGSSATASASAAPVATNVQTVPGINNPAGAGTGVRGDASGSSSASSSNPSSASNPSTGGTFSQGTNNSGHSGAAGKGERAMQGSAFAILVAFIGCMVL